MTRMTRSERRGPVGGRMSSGPESEPSPRSSTRAEWAGLLLRIVVGVVFVAHGIQKIYVLGWTGGVPNYREWGIPLPELAYPLTIGVETLGGLAMLVGFWVRWSAVALIVVMLVALFTVHLPHGFFLPYGFEYVLTLATVNVALLLLGPGRWAALRPWLRDRAR